MSEHSRIATSAAERARAPALVAPLVGAALIAAAFVVARSPFFAIRSIEVTGNRILTAEEVRDRTGVRPGRNLNDVSPGAIRRRLTAEPWIRAAEVTRDLPGTLAISIRERTPVGTVSASPGSVAVGDDGTVVATAREAVSRVGSLPDLGRAGGRAVPGGRLRVAPPVLRVASSMSGRLRRAIRSVSFRAGEVSLELARGGTVRYGGVEALPQKNAAILAMLRYARERGIDIDSLDVRSPTAPALKPAGRG